MKIGYVRVSTQEQNTIRQELLMESLGVDEVYIDRMSGKSTDRPELKKADGVRAPGRHGDRGIHQPVCPEYPRPAGAGGAADGKRGGVCVQKGGHRHHHPQREVYAYHFRGGGRAGAGVHPTAPAGGDCHCQGQRHLQGPEAHPAPRVPPGGGALEGGEDHGGGGHAEAGYEAAHVLSEGKNAA